MAVRRKTTTVRRKRLRRSPTKLVPWSAIKKHNKKRRASSLETKVYAMLDELGIEFVKEKTIGKLHVDIFLEPRTVIELQGCWWHNCPICIKNPTPTQKKATIRDFKRFTFLRNKGMMVLAIWEHDVLAFPELIRAMLGGLDGHKS